jgi:hypothetical protein
MPTEYPHASPRQALRCHWPQEFTKRRNFSRQAENQPYIEWLQDVFDYGDAGEGEDEAESEGEDESDDEEEADGLGNVRLFMKGMEGDEDALEYRDQVEHVSSFCEQASLSESEQRVALLDDRNDGESSLDEHFRTYQGPLTPQQLREELSKKVSHIFSRATFLEILTHNTAFQSRIRSSKSSWNCSEAKQKHLWVNVEDGFKYAGFAERLKRLTNYANKRGRSLNRPM